MKEKRNLHLRVQEMCDCYASSDPLKSMSQMVDEADADEAAIKWLALAVLHGINANARKISISQKAGGAVRVVAEYRQTDLPAPGPPIAAKIMETVREITHIEDAKGKLPLSIGVRDSSVNLEVKIKSKADENTVSLEFGG